MKRPSIISSDGTTQFPVLHKPWKAQTPWGHLPYPIYDCFVTSIQLKHRIRLGRSSFKEMLWYFNILDRIENTKNIKELIENQQPRKDLQCAAQWFAMILLAYSPVSPPCCILLLQWLLMTYHHGCQPGPTLARLILNDQLILLLEQHMLFLTMFLDKL